MCTSLHPVLSFEHRRLVCAKVLCVDWRICLAMPPPSKRVHEAESSSSASVPKRIRGSAANWGRAGFDADPVVNNHCFTWQNASLMEPAAMITKYDLMMIVFDRDGKNWTIVQRSKQYSVSRMVLRDRAQSVKFMLIVTDPPNVSTREIIKISREFTEIMARSYGARAPLELVPRP